MKFVDFLKNYTLIDNEFIDDFFSLFDENNFNLSNLFIINYKLLIKWLDIKSKRTFVDTIKNSYKLNIDYIIKEENKRGSGGKKNKIYILTSDSAKRYCLMTKSSKGEDVRRYFIEIEKALFKYQNYIIQGLQDKIKKLENNQKPKINPKKGVVYIFRALNEEATLYRIGRTINLKKRLNSHNSPLSNDLELILIHEADNIVELEKCIKMMMKQSQYRKYKEVYQVSLKIIKKTIKKCEDDINEINNDIIKFNKKKQKGGRKLISEDDKIFMIFQEDK